MSRRVQKSQPLPQGCLASSLNALPQYPSLEKRNGSTMTARSASNNICKKCSAMFTVRTSHHGYGQVETAPSLESLAPKFVKRQYLPLPNLKQLQSYRCLKLTERRHVINNETLCIVNFLKYSYIIRLEIYFLMSGLGEV